MLTQTTPKIDISKVSSVYSGKNGHCCCGCSGKHTYAKQHQAWASKDRGSKVTDDEVNDRVVKLIVGKMEKLPVEVLPDYPEFVSAVVGERLYIAYFKM